MSTINSTLPLTTSRFDEHQWVIQIRKTLEDEELEEETEKNPVRIFSVPKSLLTTSPDSYIPQQVPIGPYHYWRPETYEMERYKLASSRRMQQNLKNNLKFRDFVDELVKLDHKIRACYHRYLTCNSETLAWMMAVDACFVLEFLQVYAARQGRLLHRVSSRMSHEVDFTGRKSVHNAILRDLVMLENQIPLFVLRKVLEIKFSSLEIADDVLFSMLMGFSKVILPFKKMEDLGKVEATECAHLLDFLYRLIVPKLRRNPSELNESGDGNEDKDGEGSHTSRIPDSVRKILDGIWKILLKLEGPFRLIKKILFSRMICFLGTLPWRIISNLPGINLLKGPIESIITQENEEGNEEKDQEDENLDLMNNEKPPLVEEIVVPSVTDLSKACVHFSPTNGGIMSMKFDENTRTFHLPSVSLDGNTEVVFRNLVAYEACNASGPVVFTRYTELMNGIIDTENDVKLLREKGIILNHLKSDEEVTKLCNGMSRCVRLTKAPHIDKVIEDVNKYYNGRWKVKAIKFVKAYVFGSWQFLTFLACVLLLLLMMLQAFFSVFTCTNIFHIHPK